MRKSISLGVAAILVATFLVGGAAPAGAVYPAGNTFFGFWEYNIFGAGLASFGDCLRFTNNRICSQQHGKCGSFSIDGELTDSTTAWSGQINGSPFLNGGKVTLEGVAERRGAGGTINAVSIWKDPTFSQGNGSLDAHEDNGGFICITPIPGAPGNNSLAGELNRGGGNQKQPTGMKR